VQRAAWELLEGGREKTKAFHHKGTKINTKFTKKTADKAERRERTVQKSSENKEHEGNKGHKDRKALFWTSLVLVFFVNFVPSVPFCFLISVF
jgi:hypothetical protein